MDISPLYKKLKQYELDNFEDGGPYEEGTNLSNPEEFQPMYLGEDLEDGEDYLTPLIQGMSSRMPEWDFRKYFSNYGSTQGEQPISIPQVFPNYTPQGDSQIFSDKINSALGMDIRYKGTETAPESDNYDNLSFAQAFKQANAKLGNNGTFTFKGKQYSTQRAGTVNAPVSSNTSSGTNTPGGDNPNFNKSAEATDLQNLENLVRNNPTPEGLKKYSPQFLRAVLEKNIGSGEAQQLIKEALGEESSNSGRSSGNNKISQGDINSLSNIGIPKKQSQQTVSQKQPLKNTSQKSQIYNPKTGIFTINGNQYTKDRLSKVNVGLKNSLKDLREKRDWEGASKVEKRINENRYLLDSAQEEKNILKIKEMKSEGENIIFNGKRYNLRDKAQVSTLRTKVSESEDGMFNSSGRDRLKELSNTIYNKSKNRKGLPIFENGGELPEFLLGGNTPDNGGFDWSSAFINAQGFYQDKFGRQQQNFDSIGTQGGQNTNQMKAWGNQNLNDIPDNLNPTTNIGEPINQGFDYRSSYTDGFGINKDKFGRQQQNFTNTDISFDGLPYFSQFGIDPFTKKKRDYSITPEANLKIEDELLAEQRKKRDEQELARNNFMGALYSNTEYDVPEDLRMLGKSLAFDPNNAKYSTDGARKTAQGANLARGIFAGLDAVVGGARDVYSGYAYQKRQQNTENDFYEDQRKALERQRMQFGAKGGRVNDILSMFEEEDEQSKRADLPLEKLMTGEFIQQAPVQAGMEPNAELEKKEYVQHNDGEVQQVIGRSHAQGGEKLSLEPGTTVVSDKVKLGAKNARDLNKQYDLNLKAGDTFAHAVEKFTKTIGLTKTNSEQEDYFKQLKKVSDSENSNSQTSELNNSFLSGKISEIEAKKAALESSRADFTSHVYSMQEASKPTEEREEMVQEESFNENGGSIPSFEEGGPYTLEELIAMNNQLGTNSMNPSLGGDQWNAMYYQPMDRWQQYLGQTPTKRNTHLDYQKDVLNLLNPQLKKLIETGEMGLTNKHRELLSKAGVKDANNKTSFAQLTADDKKKLSNVEQFVTEGFGDGLAGHRGVTVFQGNATEEEYQKMTGPYDKLTDAEGRKIYAEYNPDNTIKRTKDGKIVFYYPKTGEKVPESKAPADPTAGTSEFKTPKKTPYTPPVLPSQRPVAPSPASPVPIYQTRLGRIDPVNLGVDQQLTEIYRQSNAAGD